MVSRLEPEHFFRLLAVTPPNIWHQKWWFWNLGNSCISEIKHGVILGYVKNFRWLVFWEGLRKKWKGKRCSDFCSPSHLSSLRSLRSLLPRLHPWSWASLWFWYELYIPTPSKTNGWKPKMKLWKIIFLFQMGDVQVPYYVFLRANNTQNFVGEWVCTTFVHHLIQNSGQP